MRLIGLFAKLFAALAISHQALALVVPSESSMTNNTLDRIDLFERSQFTLEGDIINIFSKHHLKSKAQGALGKRQYERPITLDRKSCYKTDEGKAVRAALKGALAQAEQAAQGALSASDRHFRMYWHDPSPRVRTTVYRHFDSIAKNLRASFVDTHSESRATTIYFCDEKSAMRKMKLKKPSCDEKEVYSYSYSNSDPSFIVNCPMFYSKIRPKATCDWFVSQISHTINDLAKIGEIFNPAGQKGGAIDDTYPWEDGYPSHMNVDGLLKNAPTYAFWAYSATYHFICNCYGKWHCDKNQPKWPGAGFNAPEE